MALPTAERWAWGTAAALSVFLGAACGVDRSVDAPSEAVPGSGAPSSPRWSSVTGTTAAAAYDALAVRADVFQFTSAAHRFVVTLDRHGVVVAPSGASETLVLRTTAAGCEDARAVLPSAQPEMNGHRVRYRRGSVEEWYLHGPSGLEQGFTFDSAPPCEGPKVVALQTSGDLRVELDDADGDGRGSSLRITNDRGQVALFYDHLVVNDASGRALPAFLTANDGHVTIHFDDTGAVYPVVVDPLLWTEQQVIMGGGPFQDHFGRAVAIDGDYMVVGSWPQTKPGKAAILHRSNGVWAGGVGLTPSDSIGNQYDSFGYAVGISGDVAMVTSQMLTKVYVYKRNGGVWPEVQKFQPSGWIPGTYPNFGKSISIDGNTVIVGAPQEATPGQSAGAAYVFVQNNNGVWVEQAKLKALDAEASDWFGWSVALSGDTAIVGAFYDEDAGAYAGSAYIFKRTNGVWAQQQKLYASDVLPWKLFGYAVHISGNTAVVGAPDSGANNNLAGAVYVFVESGGVWTEQTKRVASDGFPWDYFGEALAISGNTLVVGSSSNGPAGAVYTLSRSGGTWTEDQKLFPADPNAGDGFGKAVAISGATTVVGAWLGLGSQAESGSVYVYQHPGAAGSACGSDGDCAQHACVDGVCCATVCGGGSPNDCLACSIASGAVVDGTCAPLSGIVCDDGNACTQSDSCVAGVCTGGSAVVCPPATECLQVGVCNAQNGSCAQAQKPDGTPCAGGACQGGTCVPDPVTSSAASTSASTSSSASSGTGGAGGVGATSSGGMGGYGGAPGGVGAGGAGGAAGDGGAGGHGGSGGQGLGGGGGAGGNGGAGGRGSGGGGGAGGAGGRGSGGGGGGNGGGGGGEGGSAAAGGSGGQSATSTASSGGGGSATTTNSTGVGGADGATSSAGTGSNLVPGGMGCSYRGGGSERDDPSDAAKVLAFACAAFARLRRRRGAVSSAASTRKSLTAFTRAQ